MGMGMGMGMAIVLDGGRVRHNEECLCMRQRNIGWRLSGALAIELRRSDGSEASLLAVYTLNDRMITQTQLLGETHSAPSECWRLLSSTSCQPASWKDL